MLPNTQRRIFEDALVIALTVIWACGELRYCLPHLTKAGMFRESTYAEHAWRQPLTNPNELLRKLEGPVVTVAVVTWLVKLVPSHLSVQLG